MNSTLYIWLTALLIVLLAILVKTSNMVYQQKETNVLLREQIRLWHEPRTDSVHFKYPLHHPKHYNR